MSGPTLASQRADTADAAASDLVEESVDVVSRKTARTSMTASASVGDTAKADRTRTGADEAADPAETDDDRRRGRPMIRNVVDRAVSIRELLVIGVVVTMVAALAVMTWLVVSMSSEIDDMKAAAADTARAEKVALDYSTGAAEMSYEDTQGWLTRLTANTTPELGTRLRNAASQMEQLLKPLQWSSTSSPISAKVTAVDGDVYKVDAFVGIVTKNVQAPAAGVETTATYKLTIDRAQDWKITAITSNGTNLNADGATATPTPDTNKAPGGDTKPGDGTSKTDSPSTAGD